MLIIVAAETAINVGIVSAIENDPASSNRPRLPSPITARELYGVCSKAIAYSQPTACVVDRHRPRLNVHHRVMLGTPDRLAHAIAISESAYVAPTARKTRSGASFAQMTITIKYSSAWAIWTLPTRPAYPSPCVRACANIDRK